MTESLRVGIIGVGWAGSGHAAAYSRVPGVTVAGLWSRTRARAEELAGKLDQPGLQVYDRWEEMIERGDLDVLSIATPPALRRTPVAAALDRGLHVLVEKPFTGHLPEAQELVQMAERAQTVTATSFNWRYAPGSQVAWRAVREGTIGQIRDISMIRRFRFTGDLKAFYEASPWTKRTEMGGGVLRQSGSHNFDRACFLTGLKCTRVVGRLSLSSFPGTNVDESYLLLTELSNGGLGDFRMLVTPGQAEARIILVGQEGTLTETRLGVTRQCRDDDEPVSLEIPEADRVPEGVQLLQHTWNRLVADFCAAVRQGDVAHESVPHLPTFADGLRVQQLIAAAERAESERRWVNLAELE